MSYIDGFVTPVPTADLDAYKAHVEVAWPIMQDLGAIALWECWGDEVPEGDVTSFRRAVLAKEDEPL